MGLPTTSTTGHRGGHRARRPLSTAVRHACACAIIPGRIGLSGLLLHATGGSAGGRFPGMGIGGAGAQYQNTTLAKIGQKGSALPPLFSGSQATWKAGVAYEVGWTVRGIGRAQHHQCVALAFKRMTMIAHTQFSSLPALCCFSGSRKPRWRMCAC